VIDAKGRKVALLVSLSEYHRLTQDLHDLAHVAERRAKEPLSLGADRHLVTTLYFLQ